MLKISKYISLELLFIIAIASAIVLRIIYIESRELWYDEILSVFLSTGGKNSYQLTNSQPILLSTIAAAFNLPIEAQVLGLIETLKNLLRGLAGDVHPPLFYLILHFWRCIFGTSDTAMRSSVVLFSIGSIFCAYGLGRSILGNRGGLIFAALLGLNPFYLSHSLNLRMYSALVFWTILSSWAIVVLIVPFTEVKSVAKINFSQKKLPCHLILIASITAGLLTQYLFAFWVMTLAIFVLIFERRKWWQHGLCLGIGIILFLPWFLWGTRQQIRNRSDVFKQISSQDGVSLLAHFQDVANTLGTHLLMGEWVTSIPTYLVTITGVIVIFLLTLMSIMLWRQKEFLIVKIILVLAIIPLLLLLAVDLVGNKLTVGFGWGRSSIFILPGCLLLVTAWLERVRWQWQKPAAVFLLLLYLNISIADFTLRSRSMFHQIAAIIRTKPTTTLVVMNSHAWGHVLRLAYYLPKNVPISLLASPAADLAKALETTLNNPTTEYSRLIWLDFQNPVWSIPKTENDRSRFSQETEVAIASRYQLLNKQHLSGTMNLDDFTASIYQISASNH